jgi:SAM-dependent methyltransferase
VKESLLPLLRSPRDGSELRLVDAERDGKEIVGGRLVDAAGAEFPIDGGLPLFAVESGDDPTFSFKWSIIGDTYGHEEATRTSRRAWYLERFGYRSEAALAEAVRDDLVLDAGCGSGVDTSMFADCGATVIAVDLSRAAAQATYRQTGSRPNVHVIQGDVQRLPLPPATFDYVSSDQVLHHTPDTFASFAAIRRLVKPAGRIAIYVYRRKGPIREFVDDYVRERTTKMSAEECYAFCRTVTELGRALSDVRAEVDVPEPIAMLEIDAGAQDVQRFVYWNVMKCFWNGDYDFETNVIVNFDWYHPHYAYRHTADEVRGWLEQLDLELVRVDKSLSGISAIGQSAG